MNYLLDTNVLSEWSKPEPRANVIRWLRGLDNLHVAGMTLLEIRYGLLFTKSRYKEEWFKAIRPALTVVGAWDSLFEDAAELLERSKKRGVSASPADMVIAATARKHGYVLATRNTKDFSKCGVDLFNPFQTER